MQFVTKNKLDEVDKILITARIFLFSLFKLLRNNKWGRRYIK